MAAKELKEFIVKNYSRQIGFAKENIYFSMKHQKNNNLLLLEAKLIKNTS